MIDIIGIGAINVDYIATRENLSALDSDIREDLLSHFEHGQERHASKEEIEYAFRHIGIKHFDIFLGGSALNVIQSVAALNSGFRLGYIGVCGNDNTHGLSFDNWCKDNRVDRTWTLDCSDEDAGICISYISDGERSLLTNPGANVNIAQYIETHFEAILNYVSQSKILHVTSFLDTETPKILLKLLQKAKEQNPWLRISFDPGHCWINSDDPAITAMYRIADFVFLNYREFRKLGRYILGMSDMIVAQNVMRLCNQKTVLLALKKYDSITLFYYLHNRLITWRHDNQVLKSEQIEDATGAGDVFAGGFLAGIQVPGFSYSQAVQLALRLVRVKLLTAGSQSFHTFPSIFSGFVDDLVKNKHKENLDQPSLPPLVFIAHGRNNAWVKVRDFLNSLLGSEKMIQCWESEPHAGQHSIDVLKNYLEAASYVIAILTAEDITAEGMTRTRQNVVHEIGLFQGRLGFHKVVLLVEVGVEVFSNIYGIVPIRFESGQIDQAFSELELTLRRDKILL